MTRCCTPDNRPRWLLTSPSGRWIGFAKKVKYLLFVSAVLCASKRKQFTTIWKLGGRTMDVAWSRQCGIQLENAYAV